MHYETFVSKKIEVDFPTIADDAVVLPWWSEPPDSHTTYDLGPLTVELPRDCTCVVVPGAFALFAGGFTPLLTVKHVVIEDGKPIVTDSSYIVTAPHASSIFLRMLRLGKSAAAVYLPRLQVRMTAMAMLWQHIDATPKLTEFFQTEAPLEATVAMEMLRRFQTMMRSESMFELQLTTNSRNMVLLLPELALPTGVGEGTPEAVTLRASPRWTRGKVLQMMQLKNMVSVGESLESVADFLDVLGPVEMVKDRLDPAGMYQKVLCSIYAAMPTLSQAVAPGVQLSALQMARMEDDSILVEAIAVRIRQALKLQEFRSFARSQKPRLLEWCSLLDIDGSTDEIKGDAFGYLFPNLVKRHSDLQWLFSKETNGAVMVRHYCSMVDKVLGVKSYFDINTVQQLHNKLKVPLGRLRNEVNPAAGLQDRVSQLLTYWDQDKQEVNLAEATLGGAEAKDREGTGRPLTKAETHSMAVMRTHVLWGKLVSACSFMQSKGASTVDYIEVQLKSGLPYVRRQLYCQVNVGDTMGSPMDLLMEHRFASKHNLEQGQIYMGKMIMRDAKGNIPELYAQWKAPKLLIKQLMEGKVSEMNVEALLAEVMKGKAQPLPNSVVRSFTKAARYSNGEYEHETKELGGKILTAWGWNDPTVQASTMEKRGSYEKLLTDHYARIRATRHLKEEPRQQALFNETWGAFPALWVALKSAEDNKAQFMQMQPGQIVVDGSTTKVSRSLVPFVPEVSPYHSMMALAIKEIMATLAERTMHKHLFNVGTGICACLIEMFVVCSEQVMSGGEPPVLTEYSEQLSDESDGGE